MMSPGLKNVILSRSVRATLALACVVALADRLPAQTPPAELPGTLRSATPRPVLDNLPAPPSAFVDSQVRQASGCCAMPSLHGASSYGCSASGNSCVPGQAGCTPGDCDSVFGRLLNGFYGEICCPDPCYEPRWIPAANAAFFQDSPRPVTQTRFRWDAAFNHTFPDTAEYFWGKIGSKAPKNPTPAVRYGELTMYQEIATKGASAFFDMTYRSIDSGTNPSNAGLSDIHVGVKSVVLDRELLLVTTQMTTNIPVGNFTNGLGTGHVALEPALLSALKLTHSTYLQTQLAYWIPLGGTPGFAGSTFHYHASLNQNLYRHGDYVNVVGTVELNGYSFRGQFTDFPSGTPTSLSGRGYVNLGPGLRIQFCEKMDIGVGAAFGLTNHGPESLYRTEMRLRF